MKQILNLLLGGFLIFGFLGTEQPARIEARESISLDGIWEFSTDPQRDGEANQWYLPQIPMLKMPLEGYAPEANGRITVPGSWDQQGYGVENEKLRHNAPGWGWYRRHVMIPKYPAGTRAVLVLEGISRYAQIWVNGKPAGMEKIGSIGIHEQDITPLVRYDADNFLTIRVDSHQRWEIDTLYGGSTPNDYMELEWGGLWGHVRLEFRPEFYLDDLYLRGDIHQKTCNVETSVLTSPSAQDQAGQLEEELEIFDAENNLVSQERKNIQPGKTSIGAVIPEAKLWSPDTPYLYNVRLSLYKNGEKIDELENRFGLRELKFDGNKILLNGKSIFLTGFGDDHIYPYDIAMPSDKKMFEERLKIIKSFGFNHVRHHSAMMPDEYYQACDEIGLMPTGEFLLGYGVYIPGSDFWLKKVAPGTGPEKALATYCDRFEAMVRAYRNHPSILWWVGGNELYAADNQFLADFKAIADRLDPDRPYALADGCSFADNKSEFYPVRAAQFIEWGDLIAMPDKYATPAEVNVPILVHEMGNWLTFPKLDQVELFTGPVKPFWFTEGIQKLEKWNLIPETAEWSRVSEEQYLATHKRNIEQVRQNDAISGYHWWLFQDYWTTSNGITDLFFRPKFQPGPILEFNAPSVLLNSGFKRFYAGGEPVDLTFFISHFSDAELTGTLTLTETIDGQKIAGQTFENRKAESGKKSEIASVHWTMPDVDKPVKVSLCAELKGEGKTLTNHWETVLYPKEVPQPQTDLPVYVSPDIQFLPKNWNLPAIPENEELPADAVYLTSYMDEPLVNAMERGARVILFGSLLDMPDRPISWQSSWWKAGDDIVMGPYVCGNHMGTYFPPNEITDAFPHNGWADMSWYELIQGARKDILPEEMETPEILIRTIPSIIQPENSTLLYRAGVGKGSLMVSKLNHEQASGTGVNDWLIKQMIGSAASSVPQVKWSREQILRKIEVPSGTTLGVTRVLTSPFVYPAEPCWTGERVRTFVVRQNVLDQSLQWKTAPIVRNEDGSVTFLFAGVLGFNDDPATDGFMMTVNGKDAVPLDIPPDVDSITWKRGDVTLYFDVRQMFGPDHYGLFYLTVPASFLDSDGPQILGVKSLGEGSRRWFGLQPVKSEAFLPTAPEEKNQN